MCGKKEIVLARMKVACKRKFSNEKRDDINEASQGRIYRFDNGSIDGKVTTRDDPEQV